MSIHQPGCGRYQLSVTISGSNQSCPFLLLS